MEQKNRKKNELFYPESYCSYRYDKLEWLLYAAIGTGVMALVGVLQKRFYHHDPLCLLVLSCD